MNKNVINYMSTKYEDNLVLSYLPQKNDMLIAPFLFKLFYFCKKKLLKIHVLSVLTQNFGAISILGDPGKIHI